LRIWHNMLVLTTLQVLLALAMNATAEPQSTVDLRARLAEIDAAGLTNYLAGLTTENLQSLQAGKSVVRIVNEADAQNSGVGVVGLKVVQAPQTLIWLGLITDSDELDGRFSHAILNRETHSRIVRYQHINLPWPLKDRHWVIEASSNLDIAHASNGQIWERRWQLHDSGQLLIQPAVANGTITAPAEERINNSIYLPANRGSWIVMRLTDNQSLVLAFLDVRLGGIIADGLVRRFGKRELRASLRALSDISARVPDRYDSKLVVEDGLGQAIPLEDVLQIACAWKPVAFATGCE